MSPEALAATLLDAVGYIVRSWISCADAKGAYDATQPSPLFYGNEAQPLAGEICRRLSTFHATQPNSSEASRSLRY